MTPTRLDRAVVAISAIEARGEKPTARKVAAECGWYVSQYAGLNGRDADTYRDAMLRSGYRVVAHGSNNRFEKP